jgi:hypothetical protein
MTFGYEALQGDLGLLLRRPIEPTRFTRNCLPLPGLNTVAEEIGVEALFRL